MKRPKPGFKNFIKTRIRHFLKFQDELVYEDCSGERFIDTGSPHTVIILIAMLLLIALILHIFMWTLYGYLLVSFAGILLLLLHRLLRYFWTNFDKVDEQGKPVTDKSKLYCNKRRKWSKTFKKIIGFIIGRSVSQSEEKYFRYGWRQRILIFLEAVLIIGAVSGIGALLIHSPYSRYYFYDNENPNKLIILSKDDITLVSSYNEARRYIDEICPEMELTRYSLESSREGEKYYLQFDNKSPEVLFKHLYKNAWAASDSNDKTISILFNQPSLSFSPVAPPASEIDTDNILGRVLGELNAKKGDIIYYSIGTHFWPVEPNIIIEEGKGLWAVKLYLKEEASDGETHYYYTIDTKNDLFTLEYKEQR